MTHRLRWSQEVRLVLRQVGVIAALALTACSGLDPASGKYYVEPPDETIDAGSEDGTSEDGASVEPGQISFAHDIRPLMNRPGKGDPSGRGCKSCHYNTEASHTGLDLGGLDLTTLGLLRQGGGSSGRRIVVAGKPAESVLVQALRGQYAFSARMPKNGNPYWTEDEIKIVETWIAQGAKGADDE